MPAFDNQGPRDLYPLFAAAAADDPSAAQPLRILMGVPGPEIRGGPVGHLPFLVEELRGNGLEVREESYGNARGAIGPVDRVLQVVRTAQRLRKAQKQGHYDVVQLNTTFDLKALLRDLTVVLALRRRGQKVVLKLHGSEARFIDSPSPVLRRLMRLLFDRVDAVGVLSGEEQENFVRAGFDPGKLLVVKNILNPSLYHPDPSFHSRWGLDPGVPVLLFAARFIPGKGVLDAVRTCGVLAERGENFVMLCAGDGPERAAAESEARRLGLGEKVRFTGYIPEQRMRELYANATLLVFPTYYDEGFPMVVFQSVAAGLPVVTTRQRGAAHYLREYENCLWTEARNPSLTADRVQVMLHHPALRESMARANRTLALDFTADKVAGEFIELYHRLLEPAGAGETLDEMPADSRLALAGASSPDAEL